MSSLGFTLANTAPHQSCGVPLPSKAKMTSKCKYRPFLSNKFLENNLSAASTKQSRLPSREAVSIFPCAVLTTDSAFELWGKFNLDGQSEVQITSSNSKSTIPFQITIQVINSSGSEVLHWGVITDQKKDWSFPSRLPDGTKLYKNRALRTPFIRSGQDSFIKIEVDEPEMKAIEFLILDEARNKWFKDNGRNFHITLPRKDENLASSLRKDQSVLIPEDLVQIQAYLRWERKGKQNYTPSQEKLEFEEARKELQLEIDNGLTLEDIRKKIFKGDNEKKVSKQPRKNQYFSQERIQRKKRDIMQLLNKYPSVSVGGKEPHPEIEGKEYQQEIVDTAIELFVKSKIEQNDGVIINKTIFKLDDKQLLALAMHSQGKIKVCVATDRSGPLILHWALSKNAREWMIPSSVALPPDSVLLDMSCETPFAKVSLVDLLNQVQAVEFEIEEGSFVGMPFVVRADAQWIKDNGSDFYLDFNVKIKDIKKEAGDGKGTAKSLLERIADLEGEAQKSFMHRFNIAADLMESARDVGEIGLAGVLVWMRFMATRQLVWNKNYNVKPREISKAQDRLTSLLQDTYGICPEYREILRLIMSTVGRGGEGDVGQRIRDEILVIQRNNYCKGGMMEEWHQKLHNNTSPDDVVICQALIDYAKSDFDINVYWDTLNSNGITKERLLSYDRAIHSEPGFRMDQKEGLLRDLGNYMRTLKAVHSGADLESAVATCMGYKSEGQGFMVGVQINPIKDLPSGFPELLEFILEHVEDNEILFLLEGLLEARMELRPLLLKPHERLKDLIFLDIALDSSVRTAIERGFEQLNKADPEKLMYFITLVLENLAISSDKNEDLIYCLKGWNHAIEMSKRKEEKWALFAKSFLDRTRLALANKSEEYLHLLQPSAEYLGSLLGVDQWAVNIFTEEIIRAGSAASLSALLNRLDPTLRKLANLGSWQIISPVEVAGYVETVDELLAVQNKCYERPTLLVAKSVKGEEEIPDGTVAVLTPDMPDVLSHVSVRARNAKICFATCFDPNILSDLRKNEGKLLCLKPTASDIIYYEIKENELFGAVSENLTEDQCSPKVTLVRKQFSGSYAISAQEFTADMVGAKSRNIAFLKGKVPAWIGIPTSVALPFGVFEKVLSDDLNQGVAKELEIVKEKLANGEFEVLPEIRSTVLQLVAPPKLVTELKKKMQESGMPWPGEEGENRWEQAWLAIKKVWASKWNERAYFSTRKVKLDHDYLCMAVLVQEIISADYAFVIHTTNPSSGDSSEIYAEVVSGLGETLVGDYPGRALSFVCKKNDLNSPMVLGFPSKPIGLYIKPSIIFRSDSNGEDLEGYAGAGLYDSVPMDEEEKVVLDYTSSPLIVDANFQKKILSNIAQAGNAVEELYGSPQDIEGVVKDGKIFIVQTRPQV